MADYNELPFEAELCEHLTANGWFYSPNSKGYDKGRALFPEDVFGWLSDTQPDALGKVVKQGSPEEQKQRDQLLDRLVKRLNTPLEAKGGTLNVLRKGFKHVSATFDMCAFKPETTLNASAAERYAAVRVRVMRQVFYSTATKRSLDLVLFVNGLPVATLELKTDFTQSVTEAIEQYKTTRQPVDPATKHKEPLFRFGSRALVHFAVSNDEVWMTTKLDGPKTHFLPFNMGRDGGAGNPLNPDGSASSYLWERVLQRDSWLNIIGKFLHVETLQSIDPISGAKSSKTTMLFPRFHQWEVVNTLAETARREGPGHKYLVQHSAGSGKTNSIAWTAHRLARLHDTSNEKIFHSVIVVTDRTVLDDQLQEAIRQIDGDQGVVIGIGEDEVNHSTGATSKSSLLAKSLIDGRLIVVVTMQTFPYAMAAIQAEKGLKHRRFAVIADEAHSSQAGETSKQLKSVLTSEEQADLADGGEFDLVDVLTAEASTRANPPNISYFAFTATPKAKTLELFGRKPAGEPGGLEVPFHVYTMKQAIEEEFILDVLPGYQTYQTAFQIAQSATGGKVHPAKGGQEPQSDEVLFEDLVDESAAAKGLMRWVKLHPTNISQKVQIIVEHFRENVAHLLDGHAKAMVVTDSRKAAVRYKLAMDAYIAKQGYELATLVAFSGGVQDTESGPDDFTETSMNPSLKGRSIRNAFAEDEYKIMLVANKFQTGFDQPLLCAMYVDKSLAGVAAVQTLSRLNRVYRTPSGENKGRPMVLDFVNDPEKIRLSFEPYYTDAYLETSTDPNLVHDLASKLEESGIYTEDEVDQAASAWLQGKGNNVLAGALSPGKHRFKTAYVGAAQANGGNGDKAEIDRLEMFRKDVGTFVRVYDFMSQIVDYGDASLEALSIYLRLLERLIRPTNLTAEAIDLSDVALVAIKQTDTGVHDLSLGEKVGLSGVTGAGSGQKKDPKMVAFAEVIERLNDLFGDEEFSEGTKTSFANTTVATLLENETLLAQAEVNTGKQFLESPDLKNEFLATIAANQGANNKMAEHFFTESQIVDVLISSFGKVLYETVQQRKETVT